MNQRAEDNFKITNLTKSSPPRGVPFCNIKNTIIGKKFIVSLVFAGNSLSRKLNKKYRGKNKPANTLSFKIAKNEGEIFIDLRASRREAPRRGLTYKNFVTQLFIHSLLHLKGMSHGSRMERYEMRWSKRFCL